MKHVFGKTLGGEGMSFYGSLLKKTNTIAFQQVVSRCLTYIHIVKRMKGIVLRYSNMKHKYKNNVVEAFSWTWGISMLALGLYFLAERNCWAVVCLAVGAPMFRTKLKWARMGYCIIMMGLLIFCVYVSCSGGFWTADED